MDERRPSILRATLPYAVLAVAAAVVFVGVGGPDPVAVALAATALVTFWGPQLWGAYRVRVALDRFATGVPGRPNVSTSIWGPMTLTWPELDLEVEGRRRAFRVGRLVIRLGDASYAAGPDGAADLGRRAAQHAQAGTSPGQIL